MGGRAKSPKSPQSSAKPTSKTAQAPASPSVQKPAKLKGIGYKPTTQEKIFLREYFKALGNATAAVRIAFPEIAESNQSSYGSQLVSKLRPYINTWLEEEGLTEEYIKQKLLEGLDARSTKLAQHEGIFTDERDVVDWQARSAFARIAAQAQGMLIERHEVKDTTPRRPLSPETARKIDELILAELAGKPPGEDT